VRDVEIIGVLMIGVGIVVLFSLGGGGAMGSAFARPKHERPPIPPSNAHIPLRQRSESFDADGGYSYNEVWAVQDVPAPPVHVRSLEDDLRDYFGPERD